MVDIVVQTVIICSDKSSGDEDSEEDEGLPDGDSPASGRRVTDDEADSNYEFDELVSLLMMLLMT